VRPKYGGLWSLCAPAGPAQPAAARAVAVSVIGVALWLFSPHTSSHHRATADTQHRSPWSMSHVACAVYGFYCYLYTLLESPIILFTVYNVPTESESP